ncbi:uncharacterized protein LOC117100236 [Anneissia japonica]|uniref:uncharacterized protein LOC117100236 n=1 Tax=Anneissia japonica TaxID=1529436 RepID=UPI001425A67B|nr:uncharacterized protein LOC117100236 [Anneissia japonica]
MERRSLEDRAKGLRELDINTDTLPIKRALGVSWYVEVDCFQFKIELKDKPLSRRGILSTISSICDLLWFAAPVVLVEKIILQELCRSKVDWDDPVPDSLRPRWEKWRNEIHLLGDLQINRCLKPTNFGEVKAIELYHFSDACEVGYGQCTYVRMLNQNSFLIGKARVTPANKMITIPRLELAAAVVSAKISDLVKRELRYEHLKEFFWVDSKVVLGYINNEKQEIPCVCS